MSCESSTWLPEGNGARVVLPVPEGTPPMGGGKKDSEWKRAEVMSGIRKCFPFMTNAAGHEESDVAATWTERFKTLPKDGNLDQLPDDWKRTFKHLPMYTPARAEVNHEGDVDHSDRCTFDHDMENPLVDPGIGI